MTTIVIITIAIALIYDFLNGMNDAANSIATVVSTRVLKPYQAVLWAAFFNFAAIWFFGTKVADTVGKIVRPELVNHTIVLGGLIGAGLWVYICTYVGMPISVSHALIGGMIGAGVAEYGFYNEGQIIFNSEKLNKTLLFIFVAPLLGWIIGLILISITYWICRRMSPFKVDKYFRVLQLVSSAAFSLGHGGNDAQKVMGIVTVLLFSTGYIAEMQVPVWVEISCYSMISLGTMIGGWRVIKTLGSKLTDLRPIGGFSAETAGAITLFGAGWAGIPASTTHTVTGSIMGVGTIKGLSAVRWGVAGNIILAWILTIPLSGGAAAVTYWILKSFL